MTTLPPRQSLKRKGKARVQLPRAFPSVIWSGKRVSNSRPQPWQGCALPTELFPRYCEGPHYKPLVYPSLNPGLFRRRRVRQGLAQVVEHRDDGEHRGHVDQDRARATGSRRPNSRRGRAAAGSRPSGDTVFSLPRKATATLFACPIFAIHSRSAEIAISRPMMISATSASTRLEVEQHDQRRRHDQLVGHRVEERAERRHLVEPPREVAVEPVGDRRRG